MEFMFSQDDELPSSSVQTAVLTADFNLNRRQKRDFTEEDKEEITYLIKKHPYFKNPCNYPIRLITIMKYLKRKDVDINLPDADLVVDELIATLDGVERLEYGRYYRRKSG